MEDLGGFSAENILQWPNTSASFSCPCQTAFFNHWFPTTQRETVNCLTVVSNDDDMGATCETLDQIKYYKHRGLSLLTHHFWRLPSKRLTLSEVGTPSQGALFLCYATMFYSWVVLLYQIPCYFRKFLVFGVTEMLSLAGYRYHLSITSRSPVTSPSKITLWGRSYSTVGKHRLFIRNEI